MRGLSRLTLCMFLGITGCNQNHVKAIELNNEAVMLQERNLKPQAMDRLREAIKLDPECVKCHQTLAAILQETEAWAEAATHYKAAADLEGQAKDLINLGYVLYKDALKLADAKDVGDQAKAPDRLKESEDALNRATKADPEAYLPYYYLGQVYREQDRFEESGKAFRTCAEKNPGFPEAFNEYGKLFSELEMWEQAEAVFKEGLRINAGSGSLYNQLGLVYKETGRYQDAITTLNSAIKDKDTPEAYFNLGVTYYEGGGSSEEKKKAEYYLDQFVKSSYKDQNQKRLASEILNDLRQEASQNN